MGPEYQPTSYRLGPLYALVKNQATEKQEDKMAGAPTEQEVQQYLEARIETAVRELLYGNAGGNQNPRSEDVFPPTTGEHVHIAYGYAQSIRDDPDCPVLQYEGEAAAITAATPRSS